MEIEEFIDQDILIYLDEILEKVRAGPDKRAPAASAVYLTRDYEKELFAALDKGDLVQAKNILHALKEQFDQCPAGTHDKEQLRALLLELYTKFKEHLDSQHTFAQMDTKLHEKMQEAVAATPEKAAEPLFDPMSLSPLLDEAERFLEAGEVLKAVESYKEARNTAVDMNAMIPNDLTMRFRTLYARIKFALSLRKPEETEDVNPLELPVSLELPALSPEDMDQQSLLQLEQEKVKLDDMLRSNDLPGSMQQYRKMRLIAQQLLDAEQSRVAAEKLLKIHEIITAMRKHAVNNEQNLVAVP